VSVPSSSSSSSSPPADEEAAAAWGSWSAMSGKWELSWVWGWDWMERGLVGTWNRLPDRLGPAAWHEATRPLPAAAAGLRFWLALLSLIGGSDCLLIT
jgi:hypothetical protein